MSALTMAGWIVWALLLFFTANWTYGSRKHIGTGKGISHQILFTTAVWWIALVVTLIGNINKLHLLWIAPSVLAIAFILFAIPLISQLCRLVGNAFGSLISIGAPRPPAR
jgi:hypothetical protein